MSLAQNIIQYNVHYITTKICSKKTILLFIFLFYMNKIALLAQLTHLEYNYMSATVVEFCSLYIFTHVLVPWDSHMCCLGRICYKC